MSYLLKASLAAAVLMFALPVDSFAQQSGSRGGGDSIGGHQPIVANPNRPNYSPYLPNTCHCKKKAGKKICRERVAVDDGYMFKRCQRS